MLPAVPFRIPRNRVLPLLAFVTLVMSPAIGQSNPEWQGRPFVRLLQQGDPIPGSSSGAVFSELERFTLKDGTLHLVAGESASRKGLFRWRNGQWQKLVHTDTQSPTGSRFDAIHFATDETDGALNFVGEVFFGRPGFVYGLFEWREGIITKVLDTATPVDGKTLLGFGYPVRVGHQVVFGSQYFENGEMKTGIFRWDGTTLHPVVRTGDDLPGALGGFTGQPDRYQIAFDGTDVAFVASDDPQGRGPAGLYRTIQGNLIKLMDGTDRHPSGSTYAELGIPFINVDLEGDFTFLGIGQMVAAAGNRKYYGPGFRYTPNGMDVLTEIVLPQVQAGGTPVLLDGQPWTQISQVDGQGDDVALLVQLGNGFRAIYGAIGPATPPETAPVLGAVSVVEGQFRFRFSSVAGASYRVESGATLTGTDWTPRGVLSGNGAELEHREPVEGAGFFRVTVVP